MDDRRVFGAGLSRYPAKERIAAADGLAQRAFATTNLVGEVARLQGRQRGDSGQTLFDQEQLLHTPAMQDASSEGLSRGLFFGWCKIEKRDDMVAAPLSNRKSENKQSLSMQVLAETQQQLYHLMAGVCCCPRPTVGRPRRRGHGDVENRWYEWRRRKEAVEW